MSIDQSKPLILIAEDDKVTSAILAKRLENAGYLVMTTTTGTQAVEACCKEQPQLVLMDASMPDLDGFEACRQLKNHSNPQINTIPIIIVTALDDQSVIDKTFSAGAEDYIQKPVNWNLLEHRLKVLIQKITAEKSLRESESKFQAIAESANDAIVTANHLGEIIFWNRAASVVFGYTENEILGHSINKLIPDEYLNKHLQGFARANATKNPKLFNQPLQAKGMKKNGTIFPVELSLSTWRSNHQQFFSCFLRDISERIKKQKELNKLSTAVKQSPNLVVMTNIEGLVEYINPQVEKITGYKKEELIGKHISLLRSSLNSLTDHPEVWEQLKQGRAWNGSLQNKKKNGELYWVRETITPINDEVGLATHFISTQEDITEERKIAKDNAYRASHDPLTGLINRYEFELHLDALLRSTEERETHALCFIDLDHFKNVNDTAGHLAGDELLRQLSSLMKQVGRKHDKLARLGGDEFALVLPHCEQAKALQIAEVLRQSISEFQLVWDKKTLKVGSSIGVVTIKKGDQASQVLKLADTACYAAKNTGRNKVYLFRKDDKYLNKKTEERQWLTKIEDALVSNQFALYAQKIVSLDPAFSIPKYEVLLRLVDKDKSIIPPGVFLPAAERFNLATKIDCWVIEHTLLWFNEHKAILDELESFSINLSGQSLADASLLPFIIKLINRLKFPTDKLVFEITETSAINNLSQAQSLISGLQKIGVRFSLDDFGSGLSSFAYLKNLPVEFLKIDGMFVKDIEKDPIDRAMVKSINEIGQVMGKKTIAEFVEDQKIVDILKEIGVDYAQGYHYSKPSPFIEIFNI
ncbi:MAG: EAL domain-containing protein [Methylococcaceae bacterium]